MHVLEYQTQGGGCLMKENRVQVTVRIPPELKKSAAEAAKASERNFSQLVCFALREYLGRAGAGQKQSV